MRTIWRSGEDMERTAPKAAGADTMDVVVRSLGATAADRTAVQRTESDPAATHADSQGGEDAAEAKDGDAENAEAVAARHDAVSDKGAVGKTADSHFLLKRLTRMELVPQEENRMNVRRRVLLAGLLAILRGRSDWIRRRGTWTFHVSYEKQWQ